MITHVQISLLCNTTRGRANLSHQVLAPEAGIVQWCVPMFIGCISVCFALDQLKNKQTKDYMQIRDWPVLVWAVYRDEC